MVKEYMEEICKILYNIVARGFIRYCFSFSNKIIRINNYSSNVLSEGFQGNNLRIAVPNNFLVRFLVLIY